MKELTKVQERMIVDWMEDELKEHYDQYWDYDSIDRTKLGENAMEHFDIDYQKTNEDIVWDLAHDAATEWEQDNPPEGDTWEEQNAAYYKAVMG